MGGVDREDKQLKRDQQVVRDTRDEVEEEAPEGARGATKPKIENPNRDAARGDWDRSGRGDDEG